MKRTSIVMALLLFAAMATFAKGQEKAAPIDLNTAGVCGKSAQF